MPRPQAWDSAFGEFFNPVLIAPGRNCQDLQIPEYQRIYRWKKSHLETLFDDLKEYIDETLVTAIPNSPYYLGNIVLHNDPANVWQDIVDGQQRYCALTIISSALRDIALDNDLFELAALIHQQLLASEIWGSFFLSARSEDITAPTNEEDFSNLRYYQYLSKNHMEYKVTYNGPSITGPMAPTINPILINPIISRYTIDVANPTTHPVIDFGNGIRFTMISDQSGAGAGNITVGLELTQIGGQLTIPAGQTLATGDFGTVKPITTRENWWISEFGTGTVRKRSWRIPKHFELTKRNFTIDLEELNTVLEIRQAKDVAGAPAATPAIVAAAITALAVPTTTPAAAAAIILIAADAAAAATTAAAVIAAISRANTLERTAIRARIHHWFSALNHIAFTMTSFEAIEAAIYHFEKMNDKTYSLSLDAGDLMKRLKVVCSRKAIGQNDEANALPGGILPGGVPPALGLASARINTAWDELQNILVTAEYNLIGDFLRSVIISNGTNITKSKTYSTHKQLYENRVQSSRDSVPIPAGGLDDATRVAQDVAEQNVVVPYFQDMAEISGYYHNITKPDLLDITQSDRVELYNLERNFQQHRPLLLRGMKVIAEGRAAVEAAAAAAPLGRAGNAIRRLANPSSLVAWDGLFPRLIFIYEYLVVRGVIFASTLPNGGIASNRIWAKIAEWSELLFNLPNPANYITINASLDAISSEVTVMCSQYPWLSPEFVAQDAVKAAIEAAVLGGASTTTVVAAITAIATPSTSIAEAAAITAIAAEAATATDAAAAAAAASACLSLNSAEIVYNATFAATTAAVVGGATPTTVATAITIIITPTTSIAEAAAITAIAAAAAAAPNITASVEAVNVAFPRKIDPLYYALEVNTSQAAMLLATIEKTRRGASWAALGVGGALGGSMFSSSKDVEHILPRNAQTDAGEPWDAWNAWIVAGGDIEEYKNQLGNLTLIDSQANRSLGRRSFTDKQTLAVNGYDVKCATAAGAGGWSLLNELSSGVQTTWIDIDIVNRSMRLLNELFNIFDSNP